MKASVRVRATSLADPVFDIHYSARRGGMNDGSAQPIPYALVVTVANDSPDLYSRSRSVTARCWSRSDQSSKYQSDQLDSGLTKTGAVGVRATGSGQRVSDGERATSS